MLPLLFSPSLLPVCGIYHSASVVVLPFVTYTHCFCECLFLCFSPRGPFVCPTPPPLPLFAISRCLSASLASLPCSVCSRPRVLTCCAAFSHHFNVEAHLDVGRFSLFFTPMLV
eukprot:RCo033635